jgi:hypothetical protein
MACCIGIGLDNMKTIANRTRLYVVLDSTVIYLKIKFVKNLIRVFLKPGRIFFFFFLQWAYFLLCDTESTNELL